MSITFTQLVAKARLKVDVPQLASMDSTIFNARFTDALNISQSELWTELLGAQDPFVILSTLSGVAPTTGTVKIDTTLGDAYLSSLVAGAQKIYGDSIWIFNATTSKFFRVPRLTLDQIVIGGTGETVEGFVEIKGAILIYLKEATMTTIPADLAYEYVRDPAMPAVDADPLDIPQYSFGTLMSKLAAYFVV